MLLAPAARNNISCSHVMWALDFYICTNMNGQNGSNLFSRSDIQFNLWNSAFWIRNRIQEINEYLLGFDHDVELLQNSYEIFYCYEETSLYSLYVFRWLVYDPPKTNPNFLAFQNEATCIPNSPTPCIFWSSRGVGNQTANKSISEGSLVGTGWLRDHELSFTVRLRLNISLPSTCGSSGLYGQYLRLGC